MTADARDALLVIQRCLAEERFAVGVHFRERMDRRGLFWPDVVAILDEPFDVRSDGLDRFGRPKWLIAGDPADDLGDVELVCAIESSPSDFTIFITLYWE